MSYEVCIEHAIQVREIEPAFHTLPSFESRPEDDDGSEALFMDSTTERGADYEFVAAIWQSVWYERRALEKDSDAGCRLLTKPRQ